jgi:PAS domain S-box-containing protein
MSDRPATPPASELLACWHAQMRLHALLLLDADGLVVEAQGSVAEILGYGADDLAGRSLEVLFTPEDRALHLDRHELVTAAAVGYAEDDRWHLRKDGARVWITGTLSALRDRSGQLVGFAKLMRDRTDLRAQIEQLEHCVAARSEGETQRNVFLGTLAHELRNPLMPLANAAHLIRLVSGDERLHQPLQVIERQIAQLKRLVDDMMDLTRIDTGKLELRIERLVLQAAIEQAVDAARGEADRRRIAVAMVLPTVPVPIEADGLRLEQMLANLLGNALKYTGDGGHIWVKATVENDTAVIRVADDGMGIPADVLPRIFELFTQGPEARSVAPGGLGIGLALVRSLADQHGGLVEVKSDGRGRGSEFTLRLPLRQTGVPGPRGGASGS